MYNRTAKMLRFDPPYVLSLDDLPFDLLSQHLLMPSEKRRPLWSVPHEDSTYYHVTIVSEDVAKEEAFIEPYKSYLCYICNVDVPEKYYEQHNNSERHQFHKILAKKFLANVAKQIDIDINTSDNYENDEYYCEICCKVVAVKHEEKHKKSNYHLKCIENGQLTSNFLEMYSSNRSPESHRGTDNDYINQIDSKYTSALDKGVSDTNILDTNASDTSVMDTSVCNNDTYDSEIVDNGTDNDCKSEFDSECTIVSETTVLDDSLLDKSVLYNDILENNVMYSSVLDNSVFYNNVLYNVVPDIRGLNTSALNTSTLNTSEFDTSALDTSAFDTSALCASTLDTSAKDTSTLDTSELDTSALNTSVLDTSALDTSADTSSILDTDTYDSNVVYTDNGAIHTESTYNDFVMVHFLTNLMKSNDKIPSSPYQKDTVFRDFEMYLYEIIEKYKLPCNMPILEDNFVVIVTPKGYKEYISIDNFHGYSKTGDRIFCLLCQKWVQNYIKEHELSQQHATLVMQPVNDKFARILDGRYSHCLLCNKRVLTESNHTAVSLKHRNYPEPISAGTTHHEAPISASTRHHEERISASSTHYEEPTTSAEIPLPKTNPRKDKTLQKAIAYRKQFTYINEGSTKCLVCSIPVAPSRSSIIRHVEGIPHTNKCDVLLKNNNIKQLSFELYYCNVCNVNIQDFLTHINMHKEEKCDSGKGKSDKHMLKKYIYEDPLNDDPLAKKYREMYEELLKQNKIVAKGVSKFYCTVCRKNMTRISEIDHMYGDRHKYALCKSPNGS